MRRVSSVFLILVLVLLTPVLLLLTSVRSNVLTSRFLKQELIRRDVYGLALKQIDEQVNGIVIDPQYPITNAEIAALAHRVVSATWLQQSVEGVVDRFFAWLDAPRGTSLSLPVDLTAPKTALTEGVDALLAAKLPTIQPCPRRRLPVTEQGICRFAGSSLPQLKEQLKHIGLDPELVTNLLPDTLDLLNPDLSKLTGPTEPNDPKHAAAKRVTIQHNLERFKARYQQVVSLFNLAWGIVFLLAALYLALNARGGWRRLTRWTGVFLFSVGVIPAAMGVASTLVVERVLLPRLHFDAKFPADLQALVPEIIRDVRSAVFRLMLTVGLIGVVVGLSAIIGSFWMPKPKARGA